MAEIVLGIGTTHGPMLTTRPDQWALRVPDDLRMEHHYQGRTWSYEALLEERRGEDLHLQVTPEAAQARHEACQAQIRRLARVYAEARPDVAVIFGNDQMEIFSADLVPAFSIVTGPELVNTPFSDAKMAALPPGIAEAIPGYIPAGGAVYPGHPGLAEHLVGRLVDGGFDMTVLRKFPKDETPHAFGFVYRQIMMDAPCPSVPILTNTFYPPNQPRVSRCLALGRAVVQAIRDWESDLRVAVFGSGGLSHFVIDEALDHAFLDAIRAGEPERMEAYGETLFQAGTSEIKNWMPLALGMADLGFRPTVLDYVPCYRSAAGTGNGQGFVYWLPATEAVQ